MAVAFALGVLLALALWRFTATMFAAEIFEARNFRGRVLPVGVGVLLAAVAVMGEAVFAAADRTRHGPEAPGARVLILLAALAFSLLGLIDDLAARGDDRGFRGHLRAMAAGRLTTGGLKLVLGGLVAFVLASACNPSGLAGLTIDTLLIALSANLGNLFDRAPGRLGKVALVCFVALVVATGAPAELAGVALVAGGLAGLLFGDLAERFMLGDAGANAVGAVLGLGVVLTVGLIPRLVVLIIVLGLNVLSERISFSAVIERLPFLRALDRLGRR